MDQLAQRLQQAIAAHRAGDHDHAAQLCGEILARDDNLFGAHHALALVEAARSRPEEALACYDRALAIHPDNSLALYNHASLLFSLGRFAEAVTEFERALAASPGYPDAL